MYLIFYDIDNDRVRQKIAKKLIAEGYGRIQLSVFAGPENPVENSKLWVFLTGIFKPLSDDSKLYILSISISAFRAMHVIGNDNLDRKFLAGISTTCYI